MKTNKEKLGSLNGMFSETVLTEELRRDLMLYGSQGSSSLERLSADARFLFENGTPNSVEGIAWPNNLLWGSLVIPIAENVVAVRSAIAAVKLKFPRRKFLAAALAGYLAAPSFFAVPAATINAFPQDHELGKLELFLEELSGDMYLLHPEMLVTFYRNIDMSVRMDTFSTYLSQQRGPQKPRVAFQVGGAHSGMRHILPLPIADKLKWFDIYPEAILNEVVKVNGGIASYSTSFVLENPRIEDNLAVYDLVRAKNLVMEKYFQDRLGRED